MFLGNEIAAKVRPQCLATQNLPISAIDLSDRPMKSSMTQSSLSAHVSRPIRIVLWAGLMFATLFSANEATAQEIGDRVCVTGNFKTRIYRKEVDRVVEGSIYTVIATKGKWCSLEGVNGWLPLEYVMNLDDAEKHFSKRVETDERDFAALAHRGMIRYEKEELVEAFKDLNQSLSVNKKNALTWNNRGIVYKAQGRYDKAFEDIRYAVKLAPKYAHAYFNLGVVHYAVNNYSAAIKAFDEAIKLDKKDPWYFVSRGSAKYGSGDFDGALEDYNKSIELNKRISDSYVGRSNIHLANNDFEGAFEEADKAVDIQPKNAVSLNQRGWVLYKQKKFDEAMFDLNRAITYAPRLPLAYNNRAVCYVETGEYEKAIADYKKSLELSGDSALVYANRGVAYEGKGDYSKARKDLMQADKMAGEIPDVANTVAWFLATCPDEDYRSGKKAIEMSEAVCEESEWKDASFIDTLAAAYAEQGEYEKAVEAQEKAVKLTKGDNLATYQERLALYKDGKPFFSNAGKSAEGDR